MRRAGRRSRIDDVFGKVRDRHGFTLTNLSWFRVLIGAILIGAAAACSVQYKDAVSGAAVQQKIDETITPLLHSYDPTLRIEPSKCEPFIVQAKGTMGSCDLTVNGVSLEIRVAGAGPPDHFKADFGGAFFFSITKVEKLIENDLEQGFKIRAVASCPGPRFRLLRPGAYLRCSVRGSRQIKSIRTKAMDNGNIFVFNPPNLKATSPIPESLLTLHKRGKTAIAGGSDVEAFIREAIAANPMAPKRKLAVVCPTFVNLSDGNRGICAVAIPGVISRQRIGVWIDDAVGIRMRPIDVVIDRGRVQKLAQDDFNRRLRDNGDTADAVVKCEKGLIVVQWPSSFDCNMTGGGKRYRLVVSVQDFRGTVSWRGVPKR